MRRSPVLTRKHIAINQSFEGETIEIKMNRIINNNEPITDGAPLVYQELKEGVAPDYNIRADRWDSACEAMDKVAQEKIAKRDAKIVAMNKPKEEETGGDKPAAGGGTE